MGAGGGGCTLPFLTIRHNTEQVMQPRQKRCTKKKIVGKDHVDVVTNRKTAKKYQSNTRAR